VVVSPTLFIIARLIGIFLVLWAIGQHSHNFYVFLRWFIFLTGAWGAYRAYQESDREWSFILIHLALAILFNPLLPFTFQKSTWTIFNIITAWALLMSVAVLDPEPLERFFGTSIGNVFRAVFSVVWGIGLILLGALLIYTAMDGLLHRWWLWKHAQPTKAEITQVVHKVELVETEHSAGYRHFYEVEYVFTVDNQRYSGTASLSDNPVQEEIEEEDAVTPANPTYLDVEYQSTNPQNSRAIGEGNLMGDIFPGLLLLGIGLWPTVAGVNFLKREFSKGQN
jgi:hypothetical protein